MSLITNPSLPLTKIKALFQFEDNSILELLLAHGSISALQLHVCCWLTQGPDTQSHASSVRQTDS